MDGQPRLEHLPLGDLCIMTSIQGVILLNIQPYRHPALPISRIVSVDDELSLPGLPVSLGRLGFLDSDGFAQGKYVRFRDGTLALFEESVTHANVPGWLDRDRSDVRSAGFAFIAAGGGVRCAGESYSLDKYSEGAADAQLLEAMLGAHFFV